MALITRFEQRADTAAEWTAKNPLLGKGEIGFEISSTGVVQAMKVGPGEWNALPYYATGEGGGGTMTAFQIRDALAALTGEDRLDASAIKNLPTGGGTGGVGTTGTMVDEALVVWEGDGGALKTITQGYPFVPTGPTGNAVTIGPNGTLANAGYPPAHRTYSDTRANLLALETPTVTGRFYLETDTGKGRWGINGVLYRDLKESNIALGGTLSDGAIAVYDAATGGLRMVVGSPQDMADPADMRAATELALLDAWVVEEANKWELLTPSGSPATIGAGAGFSGYASISAAVVIGNPGPTSGQVFRRAVYNTNGSAIDLDATLTPGDAFPDATALAATGLHVFTIMKSPDGAQTLIFYGDRF